MTAKTPKTTTCSCFPSLSRCLRGISARFASVFKKSKSRTEFSDDDADLESCDDALIYYDCCESLSASPDKDEKKQVIVPETTSPISISTKEDENHSETLEYEKELETHRSGVYGSTLQSTSSGESDDHFFGLVDSSSVTGSPEKSFSERRYRSDPILCRTMQAIRRQDKPCHEIIFRHASDKVLLKKGTSHDDSPADEHISSEKSKRSLDAPKSKSTPNLRSAEELQLNQKSYSHEKISQKKHQRMDSEKQEIRKASETFKGSSSNATQENVKTKLEHDLAAHEMNWKRSNRIRSSVCSVSCPTFHYNENVREIRKVKSESKMKDSDNETDAISTRRQQENGPVTEKYFVENYEGTQESRGDGIVCDGSNSTASTYSLDSDRNCLIESDDHQTEQQTFDIDELNFWAFEKSSSSIPSSPETHHSTSPKLCSIESNESHKLDGEYSHENITKNSETLVSSSSSIGSQWSSSSENSQDTGSGGAVKKKKKALKVPRFVIREARSEKAKLESTATYSEAAAKNVSDDGNPLNEVTLTGSARPNTEMANLPVGQSVCLAPPARHPHPRKDRQIYRKAGVMDETDSKTTTENHFEEVNLSRPLPSPVRQRCLLRPADIGASKNTLSATRKRHQAYYCADQFLEDQLPFANFDDTQFRQVANLESLDIHENAESINKKQGIDALELSNQDNCNEQALEVTYKYTEDGKRSESCPMNSTAKTSGFRRSYRSSPEIRFEGQ